MFPSLNGFQWFSCFKTVDCSFMWIAWRNIFGFPFPSIFRWYLKNFCILQEICTNIKFGIFKEMTSNGWVWWHFKWNTFVKNTKTSLSSYLYTFSISSKMTISWHMPNNSGSHGTWKKKKYQDFNFCSNPAVLKAMKVKIKHKSSIFIRLVYGYNKKL